MKQLALALILTLFQSAPPTEVRGDIGEQACLRSTYKFQSAPPTEVRGDRKTRSPTKASSPCFNPLPPPK